MKKQMIDLCLAATAVIFSCTSCALSGAEPSGNRKTNLEMQTEIAQISTSIMQTIAAGWTATAPASPTAAFVPSDTPMLAFTDTPALPTVVLPTSSPENIGTPTPDVRPMADTWAGWPIVPVITDNAANIFWHGVKEMGTNPHVFSKIGDCHSEPNVFMGIYDTGGYTLDPSDANLQSAIDFWKGSFNQESLAVHSGMSTASVLTTAWANQTICKPDENALDCELRVHNPSIMFINLGSNWVNGLGSDVYYGYFSQIIEKLISRGVLPIITSKADDVEGGNWINETMAQAARDYDIPFYNFYPVSQGLPNKGMDSDRNDGVHLSVVAWNWRNYYALQTLYAVGKKLNLF